MKTILLTCASMIAVFIIGFLLYIFSGTYDISQLTPHNGLTKWVIKKTTHASIESRMKENAVPSNINDSTLIIEGFRHYDEMCTDCHGGPGVELDELAAGLYPKPPKIYKHATQEDPQEFFWIIKNGIKMTGMPAYSPTHTDEKIWAITAFVTGKLNKMSAEEYKDWRKKYGEKEEEGEED